MSRFDQLLRAETARVGIHLSETQVLTLTSHWRHLDAWAAKMNLTGLRDLPAIVRRHFVEGLVAGQFLHRGGVAGTLLDLGSGNGFPAVPIRVACPEISSLILVESSHKKAGFLRSLLRELRWKESRVEVRRVSKGKDLADLPCDVFTTRAVDAYRLLREGLPFLRPRGSALLFADRETLDREVPDLPDQLHLEQEEPMPHLRTGLLLLRKEGTLA